MIVLPDRSTVRQIMSTFYQLLCIAVAITAVISHVDAQATGVEDVDTADQQSVNEILTELAANVMANQTMALLQQNSLTPIVRYAGTGYNVIKGNPEGDFLRGGVDPGIKSTREIFGFTSTKNKKVYYQRRKVVIPDQVSFVTRSSCASQHSEKAFSGSKSYSKELELGVSVKGGYKGLFSSVEFSLSAGMKSVKKRTEKSRSIIIQKNQICNYGTVRYLYENAQAGSAKFGLSTSFKNAVLHTLPTGYRQRAYMQFIENWGTHVIVELEVGTRKMMRSTASYNQVYSYLLKKKSVSGSVSGRYGPYSGSVSAMVNSLNENINQQTRLGKSLRTITMGSTSLPAPIHLTLKLITACFDRHWWGRQYTRSIAAKRRNLLKALRGYSKWLNAQPNKDPNVKIEPQWADGRYALPMTTRGCPNGWHQGWRYQDDEDSRNRNAKSRGISGRMRVSIGSNIKFYYCVKNNHGNTGFVWPKGSYCIARKGGRCPSGFGGGHVIWDDEDRRNRNSRWGILPDGKFDTNTKVEYCCRNDGRPNTPIPLPKSRPFYLYRYGGRCQRVAGMRVRQDWIHWDDEDKRNSSKCRGHHPDGICRKNIKLYFCYYY